MGECHAPAGTVNTISAGVCVVLMALDATGKTLGGVFEWGVFKRPPVDILDDDCVGKPSSHASVYDRWRPQEGDGEAAGLVR